MKQVFDFFRFSYIIMTGSNNVDYNVYLFDSNYNIFRDAYFENSSNFDIYLFSSSNTNYFLNVKRSLCNIYIIIDYISIFDEKIYYLLIKILLLVSNLNLSFKTKGFYIN